jgi:hypothetical protein
MIRRDCRAGWSWSALVTAPTESPSASATCFADRPSASQKDHDRPLFGREELDRGDEGELDRLALNEVVEQPVRAWLQVLEVVATLSRSLTSARDRRENRC